MRPGRLNSSVLRWLQKQGDDKDKFVMANLEITFKKTKFVTRTISVVGGIEGAAVTDGT